MSNLKNHILITGLGAVLVGAALSGCSYYRAKQSGRTQTQVVDDKRISDRVVSSLKASPIYKFPEVGVRTYDRVVQLNGFVATAEQKRAAEEIAREAPGAVQVINDIVIQQPELEPTGRPNQPTSPNQPNANARTNQPGS